MSTVINLCQYFESYLSLLLQIKIDLIKNSSKEIPQNLIVYKTNYEWEWNLKKKLFVRINVFNLFRKENIDINLINYVKSKQNTKDNMK